MFIPPHFDRWLRAIVAEVYVREGFNSATFQTFFRAMFKSRSFRVRSGNQHRRVYYPEDWKKFKTVSVPEVVEYRDDDVSSY